MDKRSGWNIAIPQWKFLILCLFMMTGLSSFAQDEKEEVCQINDKKALALYDEAYRLLRAGNAAQAKSKTQEALEKESRFAKAYILLAELAYGKDDTTALQNYEKAIEICSTAEPVVYFKMAKICFDARDFKKSADYFTSFLDKPNSNKDLVQKADSLRGLAEFYDKMFNHPVPFDPQPMEGVNTGADEYLPVISPDNEILLFTRRFRREADKFSTFSGSKIVEEFSMSKKIAGVFDKGSALARPFNSGLNEGGASLTLDNKHMYLTICNLKGGMGSCDIYETTNIGGSWSEIKNMGSDINDSTWQSQTSISSDGKSLYFASDRAGGFGGKDIWMVRKDSFGYWSQLMNLGPSINTAGDEKSPFIHTDNRTLYFCSNGLPGAGGFDIFFSKKDSTGSWKKAENIGYPINSESDDLGFFVSTDGKTGFFASNKLKGLGGWDIYSFPLYEGARPEKVLFLKGKVTDEKGKVITDAKLEVKDLKTNEITQIEVDSSGEYVFAKAMENDQMVLVTKEGYFYDSKTYRKDDEKIGAATKVDFGVEQLKRGGTYKIKNLFFANRSFELNDEAKAEIMNLIRLMNENPDIRIEVAGHTDNVGNDNDNLNLSTNRARAVFDYISANGVDASRLRFKGYGELKPVASNDTEEGRAKNRRTEIVIL